MGPLIVITLLVAAAAYGFSWWARRVAARAQALAATPSVPLKQLAEEVASVAQELGPGSYRQEVKTRGKVLCDAPLTSELSHTPCVSYQFSVTREFEEVLWEKDAEGHTVQRVSRRSEVVASNEVSVPFWLDDGSSRIEVQPDQARIERVKTHASFQPVGVVQGVGSFLLTLSHPGGTLGYRYEEYCLPVDTEVTVVAEANDVGGHLALRRPESAASPFLVTTKSFQDLARSQRNTVALLRGISFGLTALAVLIFLVGVIR